MQWHCHLHPIDSALHYLGMPVTCRIWQSHSTSLFLTSSPPQFLIHDLLNIQSHCLYHIMIKIVQIVHVVIHMTGSLVTCHLTNIWPSRTLFRVINLIVPSKVRLETLSRFHWCAHTWSLTSGVFDRRSLSFRFLSSQLGHCFVLLCFIVAISRTTTAIEYPSIDLVLYSCTPNEELDSWQIVLAHLASFLEP